MAALTKVNALVTAHTCGSVKANKDPVSTTFPEFSMVLRLFLLMTTGALRFAVTLGTHILILIAVFNLRKITVLFQPHRVVILWRNGLVLDAIMTINAERVGVKVGVVFFPFGKILRPPRG